MQSTGDNFSLKRVGVPKYDFQKLQLNKKIKKAGISNIIYCHFIFLGRIIQKHSLCSSVENG
jgi:hypothetical protein